MVCLTELEKDLITSGLSKTRASIITNIVGNMIENSKLTYAQRQKLPSTAYAVPGKRKLPIHDAAHVRNAIARFPITQGLTPEERKSAACKIIRAAKKYGIEVSESSAVYKACHKGD